MSAEDSKDPKKPISSDYYAWSSKMKETGKTLAQLGVDSTPKRIESYESDTSSIAHSTSGSAWNHAGTWEDRDMTSWATPRLRDMLHEWCPDVSIKGQRCKLRVKSVKKCEGAASLAFIRGKVKTLDVTFRSTEPAFLLVTSWI